MDPSYWPGHVYVLFKAKPLFYDEYPWILSGVGGLSVWYTTPAFVYALKAPWDRWTLACWAGILAFVCILFQFGGTGMTQLGYRFALDFYAPLTILTMRGMDQRLADETRPLPRVARVARVERRRRPRRLVRPLGSLDGRLVDRHPPLRRLRLRQPPADPTVARRVHPRSASPSTPGGRSSLNVLNLGRLF